MKYLLTNQQTERLWFREVQAGDYPDWLTFFEDPRTQQHWEGVFGTPEEECTRWYESQYARYREDRGGMNALIKKDTGELIGHAGLLVQQVDGVEELEVAYSLLPKFWHQGFATEAARKCKRYAFEQNFAESLISIITVPNLPSQQVARRNGMEIEKQTIYKNNPVYIFRIFKPIIR
ncbi:MAG: GNAT family N-acetyltransferase [Flammeovirgaceae bacterium]|nr:MAG: GNAT family N-acetyltransferase [Flammeovirgaceae bacterium]